MLDHRDLTNFDKENIATALSQGLVNPRDMDEVNTFLKTQACQARWELKLEKDAWAPKTIERLKELNVMWTQMELVRMWARVRVQAQEHPLEGKPWTPRVLSTTSTTVPLWMAASTRWTPSVLDCLRILGIPIPQVRECLPWQTQKALGALPSLPSPRLPRQARRRATVPCLPRNRVGSTPHGQRHPLPQRT